MPASRTDHFNHIFADPKNYTAVVTYFAGLNSRLLFLQLCLWHLLYRSQPFDFDSSCELTILTLTFKRQPDRDKINQRSKYLRQGHLFEVIVQIYEPIEDTYTHRTDCSTCTTKVVGFVAMHRRIRSTDDQWKWESHENEITTPSWKWKWGMNVDGNDLYSHR